MRLKLGKNSVFSMPRVILVFLLIVQLCDFAMGIRRALLESDKPRPIKKKLGNSIIPLVLEAKKSDLLTKSSHISSARTVLFRRCA